MIVYLNKRWSQEWMSNYTPTICMDVITHAGPELSIAFLTQYFNCFKLLTQFF